MVDDLTPITPYKQAGKVYIPRLSIAAIIIMPFFMVMSRVMRKIDFGIWQKSITGGGLTAPWLLFSRQGAKGQGRRYAARLALDAL